MGWEQIVYYIIILVLTYILTPKPKVQTPTAGSPDIPTIADTQPIPVVFGYCEIKVPAAVWYGDLGTIPIKSKSSGKK